MSDLDGARSKIKRAQKHIHDLGIRKTEFLDTNPYAATPEYYVQHNCTLFYLDRFTDPPEEIALIAGDAAHNLRSALDFLAWALYKRINTGEGRHIYFPICEDDIVYKSESGRKVKDISTPDRNAIDSLKPYGGGNDSLWGLHQMDLTDKHKLLLTPVANIGRFGFNVDAAFMNRESKGLIRFAESALPRKTLWFDAAGKPGRLLAFKQGDPVFVMGGDRETHKDMELAFDIALGEPEIFKGRPILETLHQLADLVAGIVGSFERP